MTQQDMIKLVSKEYIIVFPKSVKKCNQAFSSTNFCRVFRSFSSSWKEIHKFHFFKSRQWIYNAIEILYYYAPPLRGAKSP